MEKQTYNDFVKKNSFELRKRKEAQEKHDENECIVCDHTIDVISSTPNVCKGCEDKAVNGEVKDE